MESQENRLCLNKHILLCLDNEDEKIDDNYNDNDNLKELKDYLIQNFCGIVVGSIIELNQLNTDGVIIYMFGNIGDILRRIGTKDGKVKVLVLCVIKELSHSYDDEDSKDINIISLGEVPINVHNMGIFFSNFFNTDKDKDYFELLTKEHQFQLLTESNKPGVSYRKGIYLSKIVEERNEEDEDKDKNILSFNLLRCSTNLDGPTDNFRETDYEIVNAVNSVSQHFFDQRTDLNHVLAQIYTNNRTDGKERKAKIKAHSDKTKDMPRNGLIAFCTFYKFGEKDKDKAKAKANTQASSYNDVSVLTKLHFKLKNGVSFKDPTLAKTFDVILYPNSVFIMSLSTNRLYTHEIVPPKLPIDKLPTRLGYVIRCSKTKAIYKNNQTYIVDDGGLVKLTEPTEDKIKELKDMYFKENTSDEIISYLKDVKDLEDFSLNRGDYIRPNP